MKYQTHHLPRFTKFALLPGVALAGYLAFAGGGTTATAQSEDSTAKVDFSRDIQPIFKDSCLHCHQAPGAHHPGGPRQRGPGRGPGPGGPGPDGPGPGGPGPGSDGPGPGGPGGHGPSGPGFGPHGPAGGLRLDDPTAALKGGKHGKAIIPGNADQSLLYQLLAGPVTKDDDKIDAMPKAKRGQAFKPLPKEQVLLIKRWIDQGAKWDKPKQ